MKSLKIGGKVCTHHFLQIAERFEENYTALFRAENVDVNLYKKISEWHYIALTAIVKLRNFVQLVQNGSE